MLFANLLSVISAVGTLWSAAETPGRCVVGQALGGESAGASDTITAFIDVSVIPMDAERVLEHQVVVVRNGSIVALGPMSRVKVPAGATRVDGRGKFLMPGLTDMHQHTVAGAGPAAQFHLLRLLADGITGLVYTGGSGEGSLRQFQETDVVQHNLTPYGYFGRPGSMPASGSPSAVPTAPRAAGYHFMLALPSDSLRWRDVPLMIHLHEKPLAEILALSAKVRVSVDHLHPLLDTLGLIDVGDGTRAPDEIFPADIQAVAATVQRAGIWITPTLHCMTLGRANVPRERLLLQVVKALQDAGAGLLLAGDDNASVHDDLATMALAGLSPYQALATGTRNVAQFFGILDSVGTIAVGKRADLVLLSGNPLQDIRHTREPAGVMRNGRWLDRAELDRRLLASPKTWIRSVMSSPTGGMPHFFEPFSVERYAEWQRAFRVLRDSLKGVEPNSPEAQRLQRRISAETEAVLALVQKQADGLNAYVKNFEMLSDSLELAASGKRERIRQRIAAELGGIRKLLIAEKYVAFDPIARVWHREQVRQGSRVVMPGVQ